MAYSVRNEQLQYNLLFRWYGSVTHIKQLSEKRARG